MKRVAYLSLFIIFSFVSEAQNPKKHPKPNIIFIMADDMGWGDVGFNGNKEIKTPELDLMASNSLQFIRFYSAAPVCSPTRGSILTGRHPERYGIYTANVGYLKPEELTLGEVLKTFGYKTGHFGKWHLGTLTQNSTDTMANNIGGIMPYSPPWMNGFDVCFSTYAQMPTWDPMKNQLRKDYYRDENGNIISDNLEGDDSRIIMDRVIPFMQNAVQEDKPFLALVWFHTPHNPIFAGAEYRNLYKQFDENKQHYYGAITAMDEQIGRLRKEIRNLGIEQNTIVFFTSDNGPATPAEAAGNVAQRLRGAAGPFRGTKFSLYEGGIRVPSLVEWPSLINKHRETEYVACTTDYYPTILEILDLKLNAQPYPIDGISFLNIMKGGSEKRKLPIPFYSLKQQALTDNEYKIYSNDEGKTFELYDLENDLSEKHDIAKEHPELVDKMKKMLQAWIISCRKSESGADYH